MKTKSSVLLAMMIFFGIGMLAMPKPAQAALRPGFYDLGGGQGVIVMRSGAADIFAHDIEHGIGVTAILAPVVGRTWAGRIAWMIDNLYWYVEAWRFQECAERYGAPEVYIYTIWGGLPVWADPAW